MRVAELSCSPNTDTRVAYLYERPDTSTFRYRVYNMVEALRTAPELGITASWFALSEKDHIIRLLPKIDVLVIARVRYNQAVGDIVAKARMMDVRVLFECDDLVFDVRQTHLLSVTLDQNTLTEDHWQAWFATLGRMQATAALCDGGITTNAFLAEKMAPFVNGPVHVIPNFLNRDQEALSRKLLAAKQARGFVGDGQITIGYFSGTPTHNLDFTIVVPALLRLLHRDPKVNLRIVGFMRSFDVFSEFSDRVGKIDLQDWMNLQVKIAEVDVNIAPLQQNPFTHCKSELKFFEAAAVGSWTCATRSYTFERAITDPVYGTLTENGAWEAVLDDAVALARDKPLYAERAKTAAAYVYDRYGWNKNTDAIIRAVSRASKRRNPNGQSGCPRSSLAARPIPHP